MRLALGELGLNCQRTGDRDGNARKLGENRIPRIMLDAPVVAFDAPGGSPPGVWSGIGPGLRRI